MRVRLVRHGPAGHKRDWRGDDALRPLDAVGERQAHALARVLGGEDPGRLLSSPTRRCVQTLEPLAFVWDTPIEAVDALATDAGAADVLGMLGEAQDGDVLCTHGEVMSALLDRLRFTGTEILDGSGDLLTKGTFWELTIEQGRVRRLRHVDPLDEQARVR